MNGYIPDDVSTIHYGSTINGYPAMFQTGSFASSIGDWNIGLPGAQTPARMTGYNQADRLHHAGPNQDYDDYKSQAGTYSVAGQSNYGDGEVTRF